MSESVHHLQDRGVDAAVRSARTGSDPNHRRSTLHLTLNKHHQEFLSHHSSAMCCNRRGIEHQGAWLQRKRNQLQCGILNLMKVREAWPQISGHAPYFLHFIPSVLFHTQSATYTTFFLSYLFLFSCLSFFHSFFVSFFHFSRLFLFSCLSFSFIHF